MNEVMINDNSENDNEMRSGSQVKRPAYTDGSRCNQTKVDMIGDRGTF